MVKSKDKEVVLIFVGYRFFHSDGSLMSAFVKEDDLTKEFFFKTKKKSYWPGSKYKAVENIAENKLSIFTSHHSVGDFDNADMLNEWSRKSIVAEQLKKEYNAKEKMRKNPVSEYQLNELRKLVKGMGYEDIRAFISYLVLELWTKSKKEK